MLLDHQDLEDFQANQVLLVKVEDLALTVLQDEPDHPVSPDHLDQEEQNWVNLDLQVQEDLVVTEDLQAGLVTLVL